MASKVAVVTGSNKGIGFGIVRKLCKEYTGTVILTARDERLGMDAVKTLKQEGLNPEFHQLDILSAESIEKFKTHLQQKYGGLDVLINNAGIAFKVQSTAPFTEQAEVTTRTNFTGTLAVSRALFPLLRPQARVVHVSSTAGRLSALSADLQKTFSSQSLQEDQLVNLMAQFVKNVKDSVHESKGWPNSAYGTSKIGVTALAKVQARDIRKKRPQDGILINACCPGWIQTDMAGSKASGTIEQGAETPVFLALLPPGASEPHGEFVRGKKVVPW